MRQALLDGSVQKLVPLGLRLRILYLLHRYTPSDYPSELCLNDSLREDFNMTIIDADVYNTNRT